MAFLFGAFLAPGFLAAGFLVERFLVRLSIAALERFLAVALASAPVRFKTILALKTRMESRREARYRQESQSRLRRRAFACLLTEALRWPVSSTPLIEPDVRICRIRLSDRFHSRACDRRRLRSSTTPRSRCTST
jgi:hypothetical protein